MTELDIRQIQLVVTAWAETHPEITHVILFGSRARRDHSDASDVDLAVELSGDNAEDSSTRYFFESNTWKCELSAVLGRAVSLVEICENGHPGIQASIGRDGIAMYEKDVV